MQHLCFYVHRCIFFLVTENSYLWHGGSTVSLQQDTGSVRVDSPAPYFMFPICELLLDHKLLHGFWVLIQKNFSNTICNVITCFFFYVTDEFILLYFI